MLDHGGPVVCVNRHPCLLIFLSGQTIDARNGTRRMYHVCRDGCGQRGNLPKLWHIETRRTYLVQATLAGSNSARVVYGLLFSNPGSGHSEATEVHVPL